MTRLSFFLSGLSIEQIEVGMQVSYSHTTTDADVKAYVGLSGDNKPVLMSDEYAKDSRFKARIAHGLFSAGASFQRCLELACRVLAVFIFRRICCLKPKSIFKTQYTLLFVSKPLTCVREQ